MNKIGFPLAKAPAPSIHGNRSIIHKIKFVTGSLTILSVIVTIALCSGSTSAQDNSFVHMLNVTTSAWQSLFISQTSVNKQHESLRVAAGQNPDESSSAPSTTAPQYPITATDFQPVSAPVMPEQLANSAPG